MPLDGSPSSRTVAGLAWMVLPPPRCPPTCILPLRGNRRPVVMSQYMTPWLSSLLSGSTLHKPAQSPDMPRRQKKAPVPTSSNDALTLLSLQQQVLQLTTAKATLDGHPEASAQDHIIQFHQCTRPQNAEHSPKLPR